MCQHDFEGRRIFQHRNMDKWELDGSNRRVPDFQLEAECRRFLLELASQWNGEPFSISDPSPSARRLHQDVSGRWYSYHRVGFDRRDLQFLENGKIGDGTAACERRWCVEMAQDEPQLVISGEDGITCRLRRDAGGTFRGRWLLHEKMEIELVPLAASPTPTRSIASLHQPTP